MTTMDKPEEVLSAQKFVGARVALALAFCAYAGCAAGAPGPVSPWTPISVKGGDRRIEVGVWGRTHGFGERALPVSISVAGDELLAGAVRLVGTVGGKEIEWKRGGNLVFSASEGEAILAGWQAGDDLIVNATTRIECDGLMQIDLTVLPQRKVTPKLERIWLEVPLRPERVRLFHYFPGSWGAAKNSGELPDAGMALSFRPFLWLGAEDKGLAWFAESDQAWQPQDPKRAIEVLPSEKGMILRIHLSDAPVKLPVTYRFGFQATPVKPWPADFHEWRVWHVPQLGVGSTLPIPKEWWLCHRAFPDHKPIPTLDRAAKLGAKTAVFHEDWAPIQNYPMTTPEDEFRKIVDACHERGMKVLVYHGYEFSPLAPEWAELHDKILVKNSKGDITPGWYRHPEQRDFKVCYNSVWAEKLASGIARAKERYGYDGLYLDGTVEPWGCCNEAHGCGYRLADGTLRPTYPILGVRRFMRRLYDIVHPTGGIISAHQSTCCATPTLAFADCYWDGEQFAGGELSGDILKNLPLGAFRAEFMGRNYGVPAEFLAYERPPQWTFDHALAVSMLHDVRVRPCGIEALERMAPIWDAMSQFDVRTAEWHPYWEERPLATAQPDAVKVSLYRGRGNSRAGRALMIVSNLSADAPAEAIVRLDADRMGGSMKVAVDALSGKALACGDVGIVVPLEPMRMRMVRVE